MMRRGRQPTRFAFAGFLAAAVVLAPVAGHTHPMGNFSVSHHAAIRVIPSGIELRYVIDLAEIPTFQEIQDNGIVAESGHPSLSPYLNRKMETLAEGLRLELNGRRLALEGRAREILFTPGAGDLPTMKLGIAYRAGLEGLAVPGPNRLRYRDENFPERAGWKEVLAMGDSGIMLAESSVPERDRSRALTDYPVDLLNSPPQVLEASVVFMLGPATTVNANLDTPAPLARADEKIAVAVTPSTVTDRLTASAGMAAIGPSEDRPPALQANRQAMRRRDPFSDLIAPSKTSAGILLLAALAAATLGAFHALEPGHGKTVVAAYLVGSRGTARHALLLGLIVTASHTASVYLLGGVTLYASRYVVHDRLYPWLGTLSGLIIAGLGLALFVKRCSGAAHHHHGHGHADGSEHAHIHPHAHVHPHDHDHAHPHAGHAHDHGHHRHHHPEGGRVSLRELLVLGVTGGIVPCPAALVVLLSAVALRRVGFGLFLIVAFSVGLAAVLIAIGLLVVYARRVMARFHGEGQLITRWLPLTSSAVMAVLGVGIAIQALMTAGILQIRMG
jgi:nickel/cobalt exporter